MNRRLSLGLISLLLLGVSSSTTHAHAKDREAKALVNTTEYIVVLQRDKVASFNRSAPQKSTTLANSEMATLQSKHGVKATASTTLVLWSFTSNLTKTQVKSLRADPRVKRVEKNKRIGQKERSVSRNKALAPVEPSDPVWNNTFLSEQLVSWGTNAVRPPVSTRPLSSPRVYVVDWGVEPHTDLNVIQYASPALCGKDESHCQVDASKILPCYPHSTHVAGIIGARNNSSGTVGVNPGVDIVSVSVLRVPPATTTECLTYGSYGTDYDFVRALEWIYADVLQDDVVGVASISFNRFGDSVYEAMQTTAAPTGAYKGTLIVQSAGNQYTDACRYAFPWTDPDDGILVAGAIDRHGQAAQPLLDYAGFQNGTLAGTEPGSNYGSCVDVWAPGTRIFSSWTSNGVAPLSGTSMSAPHIAGLASLFASSATDSVALENTVMAKAYDLGSVDQRGRAITLASLATHEEATIHSRVGLRVGSGKFALEALTPQNNLRLQVGFEAAGDQDQSCELYREPVDGSSAPALLCVGDCVDSLATANVDWAPGEWSIYSDNCPTASEATLTVSALIEIDWDLDGTPVNGGDPRQVLDYGDTSAVFSFDTAGTDDCTVTISKKRGYYQWEDYSGVTLPQNVTSADLPLPINDPGLYRYLASCTNEYDQLVSQLSGEIYVSEPAPATIVGTSGSWWNSARSGNGVDLQRVSGDRYVATWYTYRPDGTPIWYITDVGEMRGNTLTLDLMEQRWDGSSSVGTVVGELTWTFSASNTASMAYSFDDGTSGTEPMKVFVFRSGSVGPVQGLWYPPTESGWGISIAHQSDVLVLNTAVYDSFGEPTWMIGVGSGAGSTWSFNLSQVVDGVNLCPGCTGPTEVIQEANVGTATLRWLGGSTATFSIDADYGTGVRGGWTRPTTSFSRIAPN